MYRARTLVERGAGALFADLSKRLGWDGRRLTLTFVAANPAAIPHYDLPAAGRGVLLAPTCFAHSAVTFSEPALLPWVLYPARGLATMAERAVPLSPGPGLERLLGPLGRGCC